MYDFVIIGGGVAGLYTAYLLTKQEPKLNFCILEQNNHIGGRMINQLFEGVEVVCGAGIGRKAKDHNLIELLDDLHVPYREYMAHHYYAKGVTHHTSSQVKQLLQQAPPQPRISFKKFATEVLGEEGYRNFVIASGYTDFEKADARDVLTYYGLEDNRGHWLGLGIPWNKLSEALVKVIGHSRIHLNKTVDRIESTPNGIQVHCQDGTKYSSRYTVCATTIQSLRNLFPQQRIYHQIHGQSFLRLYAKVDASSAELLKKHLKGLTVVDSPLQEIIPMYPDQGIYMIAYSDNQNADVLKKKLKDPHYFERALEKALSLPRDSIHIITMQPHYWPIGTHYYSPLPQRFENRLSFIHRAQRPIPGVWVVGEVVALDQGWVEGALDSVQAVLSEIKEKIK
jgi:2-polyprenyl-6-methoxyphenol hydroxylase-like FAD-dependent oxidoreductase